MSAVVEFAGDVVGDVADFAVGAVEDVASFVVEEIIEPVAEVAINTIEKAIDDPLTTIATVASIMYPPFAPLIMGANTLAHGGDLEDAIVSAGTAYIGGEIAQGVAGAANTAAIDAGLSASQSAALANAAGNVASTTVRGGDPLEALLTSGISAGVNSLTSQIEGFESLDPAAQRAVRTVMTAELQGRDPSTALLNQALNAGVNTAINYTPVEGTGNGSVDFADYPVQDFGGDNVYEYLDEYQQNLLDIAEGGGYTTQWLPDEEGNRTFTYDDGSTITVDASGEITGSTNKTDTPYAEKSKTGISSVNLQIGSDGSTQGTPSTSFGTAPLSQVATPAASTSFSSLSPLNAGIFSSKVTDSQFQDPLADFRRLQEPVANTMSSGRTVNPAPEQNSTPFYTYGKEQSLDEIFGGLTGYASFAGGGLATPLMAGGGATGTRHGKYAAGGISTPLVAAGGKMRVDFRNGDAVTGEGDGQSDDIPAMLADGEFVFPADVVAAIGNGSTKAGSDKLYDMMHGIRSHARSAKPKDLPREIKSPLAFLKFDKARG